MPYDPLTHQALTFHDARERFIDGTDTPSDYLARCLRTIEQREPQVKGWVVMNEAGALEAARASTQRYRDGAPLSSIDGMPVGIKDLIETKDMPTQMGSAAFAGSFPKNDSAVVRALREAGAVVLGKTVTTALGFLDPGPTTNAFDAARTPGGSSSGSGAVVGANMVPLAIGSQLVGSVLRPASYNGNWALKPTFGGINRGERLGYSQSHVGVHANCAEDMWRATIEIVQRAGGDPGHPGVYGTLQTPEPVRPRRLVAFESEGWVRVDASAREAFESAMDVLASHGVEIIRRRDHALVEWLEKTIDDAAAKSLRLISWEQRWSLANLVENHADMLGPSLLRQLESGRTMTLTAFRQLLLERDHARQQLKALAPECDALISLTASGAAPLIEALRGTRYATGDVSLACVSSWLGAPAVNVPVLQAEGMPLGLQIMGQWHDDAKITGIARWVEHTLRG